MKKTVCILSLVMLLCSLTAQTFAGGDKHRGDKGKGSVVQHQIRVK